MYVNWLNMVRAGVVALEFYSPDTKKWGQVIWRGEEAVVAHATSLACFGCGLCAIGGGVRGGVGRQQ